MSARRLLERLSVASLLVYPSRPSTGADRQARDLVYAQLKQAGARILARVAQRMSELPAEHPVRRVVPADAILVPAPGHAPHAEGAVWTAREVAAALVAAGVGARVMPLLSRTERVRRSTGARTAADREQPLQHFETVAVANMLGELDAARPVVIVDDTVTTGSTLIACASRLAEVAPGASITSFAVVRADRYRTLQAASEMLDPEVETISLTADTGRPRRG